jgi:hypothetical protein
MALGRRLLAFALALGVVAVSLLAILEALDWLSSSDSVDAPIAASTPTLSEHAAPKATFQPPTATELVALRTTCANLGKKVLDENPVGPTLTQSETSRYDAATGHCYVDTSIRSADNKVSVRYLFDGQTGETLAWAESNTGKKVGKVFDSAAGNDGYAPANAYMDSLMSEKGRRK